MQARASLVISLGEKVDLESQATDRNMVSLLTFCVKS